MIYVSHYASPLGETLLAANDKGLTGLWFEGAEHFARGLDPEREEKETKIIAETKLWLDIYFSGKRPEFTPPLHLKGTDFQMLVWGLLLEIPYGETVTYKELAEKTAARMGLERMSAQAVGGAVGRNPVSVIVPCHRVVGADGSLTGYAGGLDKKAALLAYEKTK